MTASGTITKTVARMARIVTVWSVTALNLSLNLDLNLDRS
jgi:hypothetical protein